MWQRDRCRIGHAALEEVEDQTNQPLADLAHRLGDGRERRLRVLREADVIEPDHRQVARHQTTDGMDVMTSGDYNMVMKTVGIADLKARLSEYLKSVRKGRTLTVLDRDTPVAQIVPIQTESVEVRRAVRRLAELRVLDKPAKKTDSLAVLLNDRSRR